MARKRTLFYRREWLNKPRYMTNAAVIGYILDNDDEPLLRISDCNRVADFYFRKHGKGEKANSLYKIDVLFRAVRDFRLALYKSWGVEPPEL